MTENKPKSKGFFDLFWKKEEEELAKKSVQSPSIQRPDILTNVGILDKKFADHLSKLMDDSNLTGHDYYEMKQALKAMDTLPIEESAKYQAAFATLSTMGVSLVKLIETANQYIEILNREKVKFAEETNSQVGSKVNSKEKEIEALTAQNNRKAEQIQQLTNEITTNQQAMAKLQAEISENTIKIQNAKNNFDVTHENFVAKIQSDIEKIKTYLNK
jgi:chromosome segregation ATPase